MEKTILENENGVIRCDDKIKFLEDQMVSLEANMKEKNE